MVGTGSDLERNIEKQAVLRQALAYEIARSINWTEQGYDYTPIPEIQALIVGIEGNPIDFIADFIDGPSYDQEDFLDEFQKLRSILLPHRVIPDSFDKGNIILPVDGNPMFIDLKYLGNLPS